MGLMFTTEPDLEIYPDDAPIVEWAKELWDTTKTYYIDFLRRYIAKNDWQECEKAIDTGRKEIRPIIKKILAIAVEYTRNNNEDDCEDEDGV